jgi:hypothetical protein
MYRVASSFLLLALSVASAAAVDVTVCGQIVPAGQTGVLVADLDCSAMPAGANAIVLERKASLDLQGHTLIGPAWDNGAQGAAVRCLFGEPRCVETPTGLRCKGPNGACRVFSSTTTPGTITGPGAAIGSQAHLAIENLILTAAAVGAFTEFDGKLVARDVSVTGAGGYGLSSGKGITLTNVTSSGNRIGVFGYTGKSLVRGTNVIANGNTLGGIVSNGSVKLRGVTATGNGSGDPIPGGGVSAPRVTLIDATVTGNIQGGEPMDIAATRRPQLRNVVCGHSAVFPGDPATPTLGVCTDD